MVTTAGQNTISQATLANVPLRLAPLSEQQRIVAKVEELTARSRRAKEALHVVPSLLDQLRQSILAAAFRGDLTADWRTKNPSVEPAAAVLGRLRRFEEVRKAVREDEEFGLVDMPELPSTWCWTSAAKVVEAGSDIVYGIVQPGPEVPGGVPYVRGMDIEDGRILEDQLRRTHPDIAKRYERASLRGGDVLLGIIRATKVAVVPSTLDGANITQGTARFRPAAGVRTEFLAGWLASPDAQNRLHAMYRGIDMPGLNLRDVRRLPVPLAPEEEQEVIVSRISACLDRVRQLEILVRALLARAQVFESAVLAKAFRGELVSQDPNDESATVLLERIRAAADGVRSADSRVGRRSRKAESVVDGPGAGGNGNPVTPIRPDSARAVSKDINTMGDEVLLDEVFEALWTLGPLEKDDAVRRVADHLRQKGYVQFERLRADGPLFCQVLEAIETAVKAGRLDRPKRGYVRACRIDAATYIADDWRHALVASLSTEPTDRDEAIRASADWARDNLGLEFTRLRGDGHIVDGLRSAINSAIRRGEVIRHDATHISRAGAAQLGDGFPQRPDARLG
jgi:type I restriction enzyme S subunit